MSAETWVSAFSVVIVLVGLAFVAVIELAISSLVFLGRGAMNAVRRCATGPAPGRKRDPHGHTSTSGMSAPIALIFIVAMIPLGLAAVLVLSPLGYLFGRLRGDRLTWSATSAPKCSLSFRDCLPQGGQKVVRALFARVFSLLPTPMHEEFEGEPVQHLFNVWSERRDPTSGIPAPIALLFVTAMIPLGLAAVLVLLSLGYMLRRLQGAKWIWLSPATQKPALSLPASTPRGNRTVVVALFAGAYSLLPVAVRDEFGDEPIEHFLEVWSECRPGRWRWATSEFVQILWIAAEERLRAGWQWPARRSQAAG